MKIISTLVSVLTLSASVQLIAAPDARQVVQDLIDRNDGSSEVSRQRLSSCRYALEGRKMVCAETPRVKSMENVRKDFGANEKDKRTVTVLLDPSGERGIGFLQYDYDDQQRDADQWIYLAAMGKVKRIVSGSDDEPKEGSFFGSEFSYEDLEQRHIDDFSYRLLKEDIYQGRACWVVESVPSAEFARKSNYSKSIAWIDKERNLRLKTILFNRQGKKEKRLTLRNIKQIDGIWKALSININNLRSKRMSSLAVESVAFNVDVSDDFLTLRTLTDGAFRESNLQTYRRHLSN